MAGARGRTEVPQPPARWVRPGSGFPAAPSPPGRALSRCRDEWAACSGWLRGRAAAEGAARRPAERWDLTASAEGGEARPVEAGAGTEEGAGPLRRRRRPGEPPRAVRCSPGSLPPAELPVLGSSRSARRGRSRGPRGAAVWTPGTPSAAPLSHTAAPGLRAARRRKRSPFPLSRGPHPLYSKPCSGRAARPRRRRGGASRRRRPAAGPRARGRRRGGGGAEARARRAMAAA